jgi:hypothetical protein
MTTWLEIPGIGDKPALFVVEDGALDETDRIYDLKISPSRWIELSTCSCGSPGHWQRMMK